MTTNYEKQATEFLNKYRITFKSKFVDESCPPFCDDKKHIHGYKHKITFSRPLNGKKISFFFWNSFNDANLMVPVSAYDVLCCCSSDYSIPDDFSSFCSEFGYDEDSRKALKTFTACKKQSAKLKSFFDNEEMVKELMEIQ